jgi:hypothetical protein
MRQAKATTFDLSIWSKIVLWFLVAVIAGAVALTLFIFETYLHNWKDFDSRLLFAGPVLFLAYWGTLNVRFLLTHRPLLRIGPEGIEEKLSGFGFIPWADVTGVVASAVHIRGGVYKTLYLKVRNSDSYYTRVRWFARPFVPLRWFRRDSLGISFSYLNGPMEEALDCIHAFRPSVPIDKVSK